MIQRSEKLPAILAGLAGAGDIAVRPLQARAGRAAKRIVVTARKGAKGVFVLKPPLIIHAGDRHESDADDFTPEAEAILRDGRAL